MLKVSIFVCREKATEVAAITKKIGLLSTSLKTYETDLNEPLVVFTPHLSLIHI